MKVLLDTNIVLDLLMGREPFAEAAEKLFAAIENSEIAGYLCGTTVTTIHYLMTKEIGARRSKKEVEKLLKLFEIAPVTRSVLESALALGLADYEDAVIHEAAVHAGADVLVTRNQKDFRGAKVRLHTADELVKILALRHP